MRLSRYEQETIINFNEEEKTASVYTHNKALRRRLEKLAQERPEDCTLTGSFFEERAVEYTIPKKWIRVNPGRNLTEEQRVELAERARNQFFVQRQR